MAEYLRDLIQETSTRIVLAVMDGLGGLPLKPGGKTELETAKTPALDRLAKEGACGLLDPVAPGITPGSIPGHLALFGYDPLEYHVPRGPAEAAGLDFDLRPGDLAVRCNFCTVDKKGVVTDRRAARIPSPQSLALVERMQNEIPVIGDAEVTLLAGREHRFAVVFRGKDLVGPLTDSDPQRPGLRPLEVTEPGKPDPVAARVVNAFIEKAAEVLAKEKRANFVLTRGAANPPLLPAFYERFGLTAGAIAVYPAYRGLASLLGMELLSVRGDSYDHEIKTLQRYYPEQCHAFFFIHFKKPDSYGEDGNFEGKVADIEAIDLQMKKISELEPDVLAVTGDHSTPAAMKTHSWHPVPLLVWGRNVRPDTAKEFGESACATGGLGRIRGVDLMPLLLAHAGKLRRFSP